MSHRNLSAAAWLCLFAGMAAYGQANQGRSLVFLLPGQGSAGSNFAIYDDVSNNLSLIFDNPGPLGSYRVVPKPDGTKFYVLGTGTNPLQIIDGTFPSTTRFVTGLPNPPTAIAITPNGKYVLAGGSELDIIDTGTDQLATQSIPVSGTVVDIATSRDSSRAFVLSNTNSGSVVTAFDLNKLALTGTALSLTANPTSIALSPGGLLYVTTENRIYEIDPNTVALTTTNTDGGQIALAGSLGRLVFTPDGTTAYAVNTTPAGTAGGSGGALIQLSVASHAIFNWPANPVSNPPVFTQVIVASNTRVFAVAAVGSLVPGIYDVTPSPFNAAQSTLSTIANFPAAGILSADVSNEVPSAAKLFAVSNSGNVSSIYRIDLSSNNLDFPVNAAFTSGTVSFNEIPVETGVANFYEFNNFQTVQEGATSLPLVARLLDNQQRPVYAAAATFSVDAASGVTVNSPNVTSDSQGYVQSTVTMPMTAGPYTITLTAGGISTTFTVNVPCPAGSTTCGNGGGGGGGGSGGGGAQQQVTITAGDGQLLNDEFGSTATPLTILVTDTSGNPLPNISVSFTVTSANSVFTNNLIQTVTDNTGTATASFITSQLQFGVPYQTTVITASTQFGAVAFHETVYHGAEPNGSNPAPDFYLLPDGNVGRLFALTGQAGVVQPAAIQVQVSDNNVYAGSCPDSSGRGLCPIPYLAMAIQSVPNGTNTPSPSPASCANINLSGPDGIMNCDLKPACTVGTFQFNLSLAGALFFPGQITITKGPASALSIVSGNNQSGFVGQTLAQPLVAQITDACGNVATGGTVTWNVKGSATLTSTTTTADANGHVSTKVVLGQLPGAVTVTVTLGSFSQTFNITNNVTINGISLVSGGGQTSLVNQAFLQPLIFNVIDTTGKNVSGAVVSFSINQGTGSLSAGQGTTDANGNVSVTVTAGVNTGTLIVTATVNTFSATATLTVRPQGPAITSTSFFNAASGAAGLVPCGLGMVVGAGLSPGLVGSIQGGSIGQFASTLGGFSLTINAVTAPLQSITNANGQQQAIFQTPCETPVGTVTAVATAGGTSTTVAGVTTYAAQPGIFYTTGANGKNYGQVIRAADGSYVSATNPLHRGEVYYMMVTGLGQVAPPTATNSAGVQNQNVVYPLIVGVNNVGIQISSAYYQPGAIGVYLVGFIVPLSATTGADQPLAVAAAVNGQLVFGNPVYVYSVN
jgi:uncharacterized protein (TIGR03437 family)